MSERAHAPETLLHEIAGQARERPEAAAIEAFGRRPLSFAGLLDQILSSLRRLGQAGVGPGDRVAIVLPPGPELATLSLTAMAGATAAPLNHEYRQSEYEDAFERLGPRLLVVAAGQDSPAREVARKRGVPVAELEAGERAGEFRLGLDAASEGGERSTREVRVQPEDVALVLQTSGTTSRPRSVPLSQRNLCASTRNLIRSLELGPEDACLHVLPLFHVGGLVDVLLAPLAAGGRVICTPGFSVPEFHRCLEAFAPSWSQAVPAMLQELVQHADAHREGIARRPLRFLRSVSAPLPPALLAECERVFATPVVEIYGMTETAGVITSTPLDRERRRPGSVGRPAGVELAILDERGEPVAADVEGEVVVRGANVTSGYEDAPDDDARSFRDGWFRTGDLGRRDADGYLFLTGRLKEMINRGGEKIAPREVDDVLALHPAVADAAVFAMPHESLGEEVAAAVVLREGQALSAREVIEFLRPRLAYFKIPRAVHFVAEIPRSPGGKLRRGRLAGDLGLEPSDAVEARAPYAAPETAIGRLLVGLWEQVLEVDAIGVHDDFFLLGGDSLRAATLINEIQQRWGAIVYVSALFDAPTVVQLEQYLHDQHPELVVRMLGHAVSPADAEPEARVDGAKLQRLRDGIVRLSASPSPPARRNPRAAFILGTPRSGSTLLRAMLGGNPRLFCPPELFLLSFEDLAARRAWAASTQEYLLEGNLRCVMQLRDAGVEEARELVRGYEEEALSTREYFGLLQSWAGDRLLVDKTPFNAAHPESLQRAGTDFEDALFIHLVRHPYGVIRSFEEAKIDQLWYPRLVGAEVAAATPNPFSPREYAEMIWLLLHRNVGEFLAGVPAERQVRVRFEDVVREPRAAMRHLAGFLGVDYEPAMLRPHASKRERMTDGIYPVSRMIGDMKFHQHEDIDPDVADTWKQHYQRDFLCDESRALAASFGYDETVASVQDREEFVI